MRRIRLPNRYQFLWTQGLPLLRTFHWFQFIKYSLIWLVCVFEHLLSKFLNSRSSKTFYCCNTEESNINMCQFHLFINQISRFSDIFCHVTMFLLSEFWYFAEETDALSFETAKNNLKSIIATVISNCPTLFSSSVQI